MGSLRDGCERVWSWQMHNGNFWKAATLIAMLLTFVAMIGLGILAVQSQNNFGRLEERIVSVQKLLEVSTTNQATGLAAVAQRNEDLLEKFNKLNAQVHEYSSLPREIVAQSKALEQTRAQVNTILYEIMGGRQGQRSQRVCVDGEC